ncbi:hypothetical protein O6H91_02G022000 [Diphasiastrum complanatum]|uniref:Uncharacterized protein n=1 Tax=Diphasiastrum complanatum TaxID=34168 RepID=A0ACC2EDR2_DIPCM|nr:hypothetical protein O6H91_02G022000 [Diphasiastrum complanatum]
MAFGRRFVGPLLAKVKESTGIVGLPVVPDARDKLIGLYVQTLTAVQAIPETAYYRKSVEKFTRFRLGVCQEEQDWEKIEERIGGGQVEQLIEQAQDELQLIPKMAEWKPWEVPENHVIETIEDDTPIPSHVPTHRPFWGTLDIADDGGKGSDSQQEVMQRNPSSDGMPKAKKTCKRDS